MSLSDAQKDVDDWVNQFKVQYFKPMEILTAITEEMGELAREINNRYGPRTKKSPADTADISDELADILFNLACMANSHNINLDEAWKKKMDKQYGRDYHRFERKEIPAPVNAYDSQKAHYLVVTGIILKDGKFLITKRAPTEKAFPNQWTVPGGKLELKDYVNRPKDTSVHWYNVFEDVLKREVLEEVGLKMKNIRYLTSLSYIRSDNIPTIIVSLFADHDSGEIQLCPNLTEHAWVTLEEAKNYNLIEGIYEELEMLDNHLKGNQMSEWRKG